MKDPPSSATSSVANTKCIRTFLVGRVADQVEERVRCCPRARKGRWRIGGCIASGWSLESFVARPQHSLLKRIIMKIIISDHLYFDLSRLMMLPLPFISEYFPFQKEGNESRGHYTTIPLMVGINLHAFTRTHKHRHT